MIIDAHVHLPTGDSLHSFEEKKKKLIQEMKRNHVDKCIVIADSWPESEIGSTEDCVSLFSGEKDGRIFVAGGISPFVAFDRQLKMIQHYLDLRQLVGIKLYTGHEAFYLTDDRLKEVYSLGIRYQVPVLFHSGWDNCRFSDIDAAGAAAERYPELKLVSCHCWYPDIVKCRRMIQYPNVFFDLSSLADDPAILDSVGAEVTALIRTVPDRVVYGSDAFGCSMQRHLAFIKGLRLPPLLEQKVFSRNAERIYGLK